MKNEVYAIMNMEKFAAYVREKAALSIASNYDEDLDEFISIKQVCMIVQDCSVGKDENERCLLDEEGRELLSELLRVRLYNVGLAKLAAADKLQCAWDDESNEMVFWVAGTVR
jgi:hypothetical protein